MLSSVAMLNYDHIICCMLRSKHFKQETVIMECSEMIIAFFANC